MRVQPMNMERRHVLSDADRLRLLKLLEANPELTQRQIADHLDISLGRVNYGLKALIEKGLVKMSRFRNSTNKWAYLYLLTPHGIEAKSSLTLRFLRKKMEEHRLLEREIEQLRIEAQVISARQREGANGGN